MRKVLTFSILSILLTTTLIGIEFIDPNSYAYAWNRLAPDYIHNYAWNDFIAHNEKGCWVRYVDQSPVIDQGQPLNIHNNTLPKTQQNTDKNCYQFGEYIYPNDAINIGETTCSAGALTTVVDTYMNRLYHKDVDINGYKDIELNPNYQYIIEDSAYALEPDYHWRYGYIASSVDYTSQYREYAFTGFSYAARRLMKQKNLSVGWVGYGFNSYNNHELARNFFPWLSYSTKVHDLMEVLARVNYYHIPIIMGMTNHFTTVIGYDYSSKYLAVLDTHDLIAAKWGGKMAPGNAIQLISISSFLAHWWGEAYILEPSSVNPRVTFSSYVPASLLNP